MKSLTIIGRRWFNDREGNTYYSGVALVDGKEVARESFAYGYGDQYVAELWEKVVSELELADVRSYSSGGIEAPSFYCRKHGIAYHAEAIDVARKRDM
jgi:hypothetical protein